MSTADYPRVEVAVALFLDKQLRVFFQWNDHWGAFALPMSKRRRGSGVVESAEKAARRAAAEAMGVPCRVGEHRTAVPDWQVSERDYQVKRYTYEIYRAEVHLDYARTPRTGQPHLWLTTQQAFSGDYQPITQSSLDILTQLVADGQLPGTVRYTSVLLAKRTHDDQPQFLLRYHPDWGYALPGKQRSSDDSPLEAARTAVAEDLGLTPGTDVVLGPAHVRTYPTHDISERTQQPTYYIHSLFRADLQSEPKSGDESRPLAWASETEIRNGHLIPEKAAPDGHTEISRTVFRILSALDEIHWIDFS